MSANQEQQQAPRWIVLAGGRKMAAYFASLLVTTGLAAGGLATTEILFAVQSALAFMVGGNAAEHKYRGGSEFPRSSSSRD
jgi:hypothetical protein